MTEGLSNSATRALELGAWTTTVKPTTKTARASGWGKTVTVSLGVPQKPVGHSHHVADKSMDEPYGLHGPAILPKAKSLVHSLTGIASYYWQGQKTATGEKFDPTGMTAAHKTLPFGTRVRVTRVDTGDSVVVRINDRGPFKPGRVIDLSKGAAQNIGMLDAGLTDVRLEVLGKN